MDGKFQRKYRIPSARLVQWDYRDSGSYFITICVAHRVHSFGEIVDGEMQLSPTGKIAWDSWYAIPAHFLSVQLDAFTVMPNHLHGILLVDRPKSSDNQTLESGYLPPPHTDVKSAGNDFMSGISPKAGSVSTMLRSYKSAVSREAHLIQPSFKWQPRFWDNIIPNAASFDRIQGYIHSNVKNWREDGFYT